MEIGRVAEIDLAQSNHAQKVKSVQEVDNKHKVFEDEQYKKAEAKLPETTLNEVMLDNIKFGYNKKSEDFFVKVTRGEDEFKYPTEDMMRVKALLLSELREENRLNNK